MAFNEANSVEEFVRDLLSGEANSPTFRAIAERRSHYAVAGEPEGPAHWEAMPGPELHRATKDVLIDGDLRLALINLNPQIAAKPGLADEVIYKLRAPILGVRSDGLVRSNEAIMEWLRGDRTMPFGPNGEHTTVRLIDFDQPHNNRFVVANQVSFVSSKIPRRFDLVLYVNGIPVVVGEAKTPTREAVTWVDGADDIYSIYEPEVPEFFAPNVFSFATDGKEFRFAAIGTPLEWWAPWRADEDGALAGLGEVERAVASMLRPAVVLDILQNFTLYATDKQHRKVKVICRYQQYETANQIVQRVVEGQIKKGLIWHFQGSGKSLLMVFAAQKLRLQPALKNPTVLIVVDRIDLDTQITATFNATDVPNTVTTESRAELQALLAQDVRKVVITTIHKFGEAPGVLNNRSNIIAMVDEAHRTQEGDLGRQMRQALPHAFLFGLTGTPINSRDRNTFWTFGAEEDEHRYMSRYSFEESVRDKATLPLHFEARLVELRVDQTAIDEAYTAITGELNEEDQNELAKRAAKLAVLLKSPERVRTVVEDVARHYQENVEPNGFKAQLVAFDREACILYKNALDQILPPEMSEVVISASPSEKEPYRHFWRAKDEEERLLDRFRSKADPLKILIVTAKLLTGFDAPILQAMYLDKPLKDHTLVQAICRTNRPYPQKQYGLIVDYLGVFDDVSQSLTFDEASIQQVITNLERLRGQIQPAVDACLAFFPGVDRTVAGYEGLLAAQERVPDNDTRDRFAAEYSALARLWEALSPDAVLNSHADDYRWLSQVYESVRPPSGHGKLLWHALGAKTVDLIHENVHVEAVRDDLETLVLDADVLAELAQDEPTKAKEVEIKISARLRKHLGDARFVALGERLEALRQRHAMGLMQSLDFLKQLLQLAKEVVETEQEVEPAEEVNRGKAALTELFQDAKTDATPVMVERIVNDIDAIVRLVRFPDWQRTNAGERDVQRALRKTLLKYQLHREQELFDKAFAYIKQYY